MTTETETGKTPASPGTKTPVKKSWYVVHTYSGYENKAKQALEDKVRANGLEEYFGQILVPSEKVTETKSGVKRTSTKKFFPSYLFVEMELNDKTWHLVKNTPKITGFVGGGTRPSPVPEAEVLRITNQIAQGTLKPVARVAFEKGETVRVSEGPLQGFTGLIEEVNLEKGKAKVMVSILGRSTPVDLAFNEIEKT
jgi:transcriptional antiterminator NusG